MSEKQRDAIVIGAGILGLLTAWRLSEAGLDVLVLEKGQVGREASWAGAGILSPLHPWLYPKPIQALAEWSQARYPAISRELHEATGIDPEWTNTGLLILEPNSLPAAQEWAKTESQEIEILTGIAMSARYPEVAACEAGILLPNAAHIRSPRLLKALRALLTSRGVEIVTGTCVESIHVVNGRVQGAMTGRSLLRAKRVIVAAGAWSGAIEPLKMSIEPVRGQMLLYGAMSTPPTTMVLQDDIYIIPRRDGRVLVGSSVEYCGYDATPTPTVREELRSRAEVLIPKLKDARLEMHWAGLRPGRPDNLPYICSYPGIQGLYINTGHSRHGLLTAVASSQLLADIIMDRVPILNPTPYELVLPLA